MAAYASVVTLARNIDPIHGDLNRLYLDMDLKPLYEKVVQLQAIMDDCPGEALSNEFQARIRDYAYRANNVMETHFLNTRAKGKRVTLSKLFLQKKWHARKRVILSKLQELTDEAGSLVVEAQDLQGVAATNQPIMKMKEPSSSSGYPPPGGATRKLRLYSDITNLEERFYEGCSQRQVIPIVGMGGSGKTTLANFLFKDSRTANRFDRCAWITVSQSYERCTLLSQILRQFNESAPENPDDAQYKDLAMKVFQILKNRRYLIVIDDVWSEKLWDDINIYLPDDGIGSRILLTTRLQVVADYAVLYSSERYIHVAELMDLDSSWSLLKDTVFGEDEDCPIELEEIGKSIAKKCRGLPLAIVVIAGVLSSTNNERDLWEKVEADVTIAINSGDGEKILSLSYINLPHHLKPCFLYLVCFPEDYKFKVSKLIMLWIGEGFLNLNKSERYVSIRAKKINEIINSETYEEENVAYEYLEDLVKRNLVLVSETDHNEKIMECCLHDVIRELCIEIAGKENFMLQVKGDCELTSGEIKDQTRFNFCSEKSLSLVEKIHNGTPIRTILYYWYESYDRTYDIVFRMSFRFRLLHVLDIESIEFEEFPCQVMQLFLLRYLALRATWDYRRKVEVPSSIKELQSLQVLRISTSRLMILPLEIWNLPKLRHLMSTYRWMKLPDPPIGTRSSSPSSSLENLQSLIGVANFKFTEQVVQMIPNVKMLGIRLSVRHGEYCLWNLVGFAKLETLRIRSGDLSRKNIQLPPSLKELKLFRGDITWSDLGEVAGSLPNLEVMILENNDSDEKVWEVKEGEFPNLKVLEIWEENLAIWKYDGETGRIFANLERLRLFDCRSMKEFPRCIGEIDTLRVIEVLLCSELLKEWAREVKEEQESYGNEDLQVIIRY